MKCKSESVGRLEAKVHRAKRFRHGFNSATFKRYQILDRDVRKCDAPTPEMLELLGMAMATALHAAKEATDARDPDSWRRYQHFVKNDVIRTVKILKAEAAKNFRTLKARRD